MSMRDFKEFFTEADTDNDGYLIEPELKKSLEGHGYKISQDDFQMMFQFIDIDGDQKISMQEFLTAMENADEPMHDAASMREVFRVFDKDNNGTIDRNELKEAFARMGEVLSDAVVQKMMELADKDKSGTLDYEEFIAMMSQ